MLLKIAFCVSILDVNQEELTSRMLSVISLEQINLFQRDNQVLIYFISLKAFKFEG